MPYLISFVPSVCYILQTGYGTFSSCIILLLFSQKRFCIADTCRV